MNSFFMPPPILILGIFLFVVNCLGVHKAKFALIAAVTTQTQNTLDSHQTEHPVAIIKPDGSKLPVADISRDPDRITETGISLDPYRVTEKDGEAIFAHSEVLKSMNLSGKEFIEKSSRDFAEIFYKRKLNTQQILDEAEDAFLGIPLTDYSLSSGERVERERQQKTALEFFHTVIRADILTASKAELQNLKDNLTIAIYTMGLLEDTIKAQQQLPLDYFNYNMKLTIETRMLVIDRMFDLGIAQ
jgi:hypothetical protein